MSTCEENLLGKINSKLDRLINLHEQLKLDRIDEMNTTKQIVQSLKTDLKQMTGVMEQMTDVMSRSSVSAQQSCSVHGPNVKSNCHYAGVYFVHN